MELLFLLLIIPYLLVGLRTARAQYTLEYKGYVKQLEAGVTVKPESISVLSKREWTHRHRDLIDHAYDCTYPQYTALYGRDGCTCDEGLRAWRKYVKAEQQKSVPPSPPKAKVSPVITWPLVMTKNYVVGGTDKIVNPIETKQLERELLRIEGGEKN